MNCFFGALQGMPVNIECGPNRKGTKSEVISCETLVDKNVEYHLKSINVKKESNIKDELDLILWRSGKINVSSKDYKTWIICPAHEEQLGVGWRTGRKRCKYQNEDGSLCNLKQFGGINTTLVVNLKEKTGQLLQVGDRKYFA